MPWGAVFASSFWVHAVYLDIIGFLRTDSMLLCPRAVAKELGRKNPTSLRLQECVKTKSIQVATPKRKSFLAAIKTFAATNKAPEFHERARQAGGES